MMAVVKLLHVSNKSTFWVFLLTPHLFLAKRSSNEVKEQIWCHCSLHERQLSKIQIESLDLKFYLIIVNSNICTLMNHCSV